jgi:hypothetical protein
MIYVHPDQGVVYIYDKTSSFEDQSKYIGSMGFKEINPKVLHVYNILTKTKMKSDDYIDMITHFKKSGYKWLFGYFPTGWVPKGFTETKYGFHEMEL